MVGVRARERLAASEACVSVWNYEILFLSSLIFTRLPPNAETLDLLGPLGAIGAENSTINKFKD